MQDLHPSRQAWETADREELFRKLIGHEYGREPLSQSEQIQQDKRKLAQDIMVLLGVRNSHEGLELGSGCGYLTEEVGGYCRQLWACDISQSFLAEAQTRCQNLPAVQFLKIEPGRLHPIRTASLDFAFANNVFIHLDLFEIVQYLQELRRVMKPGGRVWFDFVDLDRLDVTRSEDFLWSARARAQRPTDRGCLQFHSRRGLRRVFRQLGWTLIHEKKAPRGNTQVILCCSPSLPFVWVERVRILWRRGLRFFGRKNS